MDAEARFRWLQKLASEFPSEGFFFNLTVGWENEHGAAGVISDAGGMYVYLFTGQQTVGSLEEAVALLRRVFADEIVCVTAYAKESIVYNGLAEAHAPSVGFNSLDGPSMRDMPDIDIVLIESWSRGAHEDDDAGV